MSSYNKPTIEINKLDAQENIEKYQLNQITGWVFLIGLLSHSLENVIFYTPPSINEEFDMIKDSIDKNEPLLIILNPTKFGQHAVTPIGYSSNLRIVYIYDNNLPYQTHEIKFYDNYIKYMDDDKYQEKGINFNTLMSEKPPTDLSGLNEKIKQFAIYLKKGLGDIESYIVTLMCPADLRIVDQYGRVITTLNGESNEIPDAFLNSGEEFEIYNLPSNLEYTIELIGTGNGNAELSFASKDVILTFDDIQITPLTRGKMYIGKTNSYILSLDNNNDGIIDEYLTPLINTYTEHGYNITFLPPITTMEQFSIKNGNILPIKFTVKNCSTDEFIYDDTVNVTIINSTGNVITYFTNGTGTNSVRINSIDEQYAVDFNTNDYPELIIGKPYSIQVTFGDIGNLQGYAIAYFTLINGTPPSSITHLHPTPCTTWLNWTWTNPSDPDFNHTEIYLDDVFQTITSAEHFNATDLAPGTEYTISTRTVDTAGNINQTYVNDTATTLPASDTNPPTITITSPVSGTTYSTDSVNLNYSVNKPTAWQGYSLDGTANITLHGNTTLTGFADGLHTLTVSANDTSGNMNSSTVCFTIATTTPAVNTVTLNTTTPNTGDSILVTVNATDDVAVISVAANDVVLSHQSGDIWTGTITAIAGIHYVNVSATDATGNVGWNNSTSYTATTPDIIPPAAIANLHPTVGTTWINWTWTNPSDPDFNHVEIYINGTLITNVSAPQNYYNTTGMLPNTSYELSTRTADTAGNVNETWVNDTARTLFISDDTPPTITFSSPDTITHSPTITITGTAFDTSGIASVTVNGEPATGTTTWSAEVTLTEGENAITVVATDGAGLNTTKMITVWLEPPRGDLNGDYALTPADAAIALWIAASGGWDANADVSGDNRVTSLDALMILQAAAGAIDL